MRHEAHWEQLESFLNQIDKRGIKSLNHDELLEFGRLYRRTSADLSFAQAHGLDPNIRAYLNRLIGRAYTKVYRDDSKRNFSLQAIWNFIRVDFPRAVRAEWAYIATAAIFFVLAMGVAFWATLNDEAFARALLPHSMIESMAAVIGRHEEGGNWMPGVFRPIVSSLLMTNNIQVSFLAFALGITGVGTFYILGMNGLMLGTLTAMVTQADLATASNLWGFVAPHGVIEIPAILLSAGAGLILGYALINPGRYTRKVAIRSAAKRAVPIVVGVIGILIVAGLIEAFFSPSLTPDWIKFTFAGILFAAFISYLFLVPIPSENER